MTTENKLEVKYKKKAYEIKAEKGEQKVKPKDGKDTDKEITVKDYEEGGFFASHKCKCSEDGTNFELIDIKWGAKKHITIWGLSSVLLVGIGLTVWYFLFKNKDKEVEEKDE